MLGPMVALRALRRRPFTKGGAIGWALLGFFAHHIFFTWLSGAQEGNRLFITLGAFASYYVLTWSSARGLRASEAARRRELGYDE